MQAIITGASSGIGEQFARDLARRGYDVILLARRKDKLEMICESIEKENKVTAKYYSIDLSNIKKAKALAEKLSAQKIDILINNAGFGDIGFFSERNIMTTKNLLDLNVSALQMYTQIFLKEMMKQNEGMIINIASIAALMPIMPTNAAYVATKQYVYWLTRTINMELKMQKSAVRLISIQPGQINTNWANTAGIEKVNYKGTPASVFVKKALKSAIDKRKDIVWGGKSSLVVRIITRLLSKKLVGKISYNILRKMK